jgi:UV DNA damage repair endonuclease
MDTLITQGTLTLSMVITVPQLSNRSRTKTVTLARYHYVSKDDAKELKAKFLRANDELIPEFITAKWEFVEYL